MNTYAGTFVISFASLIFEVTLVRLLSVTTWYHLAFLSISAAMLGMTAGAARVYLRPRQFDSEQLSSALASHCMGFALVVPVTVILLCLLPLDLYRSVMSPVAFLLATLVCAAPFFFVGVVVTAVITKSQLPVGRLYAADLAGASAGCLFVLLALGLLDAPSLLILCGALSCGAGLVFAWKADLGQMRRRCISVGVLLSVLSAGNASTSYGIRPAVIKGRIEGAGAYAYEKWNSFSRIVVYKGQVFQPQLWGASPVAPREGILQYEMNIDGEAGTVLRPFSKMSDIEHLRYDVTNIGYFLRPSGGACVIGVGGGRDVQSALLFGHERVTGIEINPILVGLLEGPYREFAGIADHEGVRLVVDDARSYLARHGESYRVIQMSLIDTWAATGAGAFSLSENSLYTIEAWKIFLDRLSDNGLFTVSRWHNPSNIGETGRILSLAVATLLSMGVERPWDHLALITSHRISTLLVGKDAFSPDDSETLRRVCSELQYEAVYLPGSRPPDGVLGDIITAPTMGKLMEAVAGSDLNYDPPSDENPYFFNMLRLNRLPAALEAQEGVLHGNLVATLTLLVLLTSLSILTVLSIAFPLAVETWKWGGLSVTRTRVFWLGCAYFLLIGVAFMLTEIALIQRLSVFLGHPIYALSVLLFTLIASAGLGSLLSEVLPLSRSPGLVLFPLLTASGVVAERFVLRWVLSSFVSADMGVKVLLAVALIGPLGFCMGFFFPTGMRLASTRVGSQTPWFWALNGIAGVLSSSVAVLISIYVGISVNFYIAAACYVLAGGFLIWLEAEKPRAT